MMDKDVWNRTCLSAEVYHTLVCACVYAFLSSVSAPAFAVTAHADDAPGSGMPALVDLQLLREQIQTEPLNLDHYFNFAMTARAMGKYDDAEWAYKRMLQMDSSLDRVRLELSLVYINEGKFKDAKKLLTEVLKHHPPEEVRSNIKQIMMKVDEELKRNVFHGSVSTGMNWDKDANSSPGSGNVSVIGTTVPLDVTAKAKADLQGFAAATLQHIYHAEGVPGRLQMRWNTAATAYATDQADLKNLNVMLFAVRSGPQFTFPRAGGLSVEIAAGYSNIVLDKQEYLRDPKGEIVVDLPLPASTLFEYAMAYEYRQFVNSPTVTTYEDRSGNAWQQSFTLRHTISDTRQVEGGVMLRHEDARESFYANKQVQLSLGYIQLLPWDSFAQMTGAYKISKYDSPDFLVSDVVREDDEYDAGITLGKTFKQQPYIGDMVWTVGYQYRDVWSNVINYKYVNHRFDTAITKNF
jgi:tetratricopeptide (TPR) repeat protein